MKNIKRRRAPPSELPALEPAHRLKNMAAEQKYRKAFQPPRRKWFLPWRVRQDSNLQPSDPKFGPAGFCPVVTSCTRLQILNIITPSAAADYKMLRLKKAGNDPRRKLEVNRSFNNWLRCAKSLFSEAILCKPNFRVKVPRFKARDGQRAERDVYWFETASFERQGSMKFQAPTGITHEALVTSARQELRTASPEAYKLFLLCLCAGLRRGEADVCLWSQLNAEDNSIRLEASQYIEPKHGSGFSFFRI